MGTRLVIEFRASRKYNRGDSHNDNGEIDATARLKEMLVNGYDQAKVAYNALPTSEAKASFLDIFEDFTEADFLMGAWRTEMILDLIDDDCIAREKLTALELLIDEQAIVTNAAE